MIVAVGWLVWKILKRFFVKSSIATSPNDDGYVEELFRHEDIQVKSYNSVHSSNKKLLLTDLYEVFLQLYKTA